MATSSTVFPPSSPFASLIRRKGAQGAPVRAGGLLPRSIIAFVAHDLLRNYDVTSPGPYLMELISDLLGISQPRDEDVEYYTSREKAAYILAQAPHMSSEVVAKAVGVDRTSLSRWKKEPRFQERVLQVREVLEARERKSRKRKMIRATSRVDD